MVEDEPLLAIELADLLSSEGFIVIGPAPSVKSALLELDSHTPDVAVLDGNLRGELITPVAELLSEKGIPFVFASANADCAAATGFDDVTNVGKPLPHRKLVAVLRDLVERMKHPSKS